MKISLLIQLRPRSHVRFEKLPILGPLIEEFVEWLNRRGYRRWTISFQLTLVSKLVIWLRRQRIHTLSELTVQILVAAGRFHKHNPCFPGTVRALRLFLLERQLIAEPEPIEKSPLEIELEHFADHLRSVRGFAERTVDGSTRRLHSFLKMIRYDRDQTVLSRVGHSQIEMFLKQAAKTNNRFSLQHIVATLRAYFRLLHARGILTRPLHEQIDTPRVYRLERLPRAVAWSQVRALLRSIDQKEPRGLRDFTILYLAAAYGLRSSELVHLKLEDIDWQHGFLRVPQTKTKQTLQLPLTDESGDVLLRYLRKGRPLSERRELFLRARAPSGSLGSTAIREIMARRIRYGGFDFPSKGAHTLRHSFALHLLQRKVAIKTIGDVLGHRDAESTGIYLRLGIHDLRRVGLPVPCGKNSLAPWTIHAAPNLHPIRSVNGTFKYPPADFYSHWRKSMQRYLAIKCALGRIYANERRILLDWDDFLHRHRIRNVGPDIFQLWIKRLDHLMPTVRRNRMRIVRNFLLFHARNHPGSFVPDIMSFPKPHPKYLPRLVSESEMARVLSAVKQLLTSNNPFRSQTMRLAFVLLYCCGLRRGELLRLRLKHFDATQQLLRIEQTKFHKSRLVPLVSSVVDELQDYLEFRQKSHLPMEADSFLIWNGRRRTSDTGYSGSGLCRTWRQLCKMANVLDHRGCCPRVHDLRHSFAVNALHRWYLQKEDVQTKLPHLATYLGHVSPVSTHYYLHLTPELRQAANDRFHQRFAPLFVKGGAA